MLQQGIFKEQRVAVFVDVQNMYYSAKNLYNSKVRFDEILKDCVRNRVLVRAIAYGIKADVKDESNFHEALENIGYEVKLKDLLVFHGGHKKGDWDIGIAMDAVRAADKVDVVVVVSGDGDFRELYEYLRGKGCRVEVMAFGRTASSSIKDFVDRFTDMDKNKKYLLAIRQHGSHHGNNMIPQQNFTQTTTLSGNSPNGSVDSTEAKAEFAFEVNAKTDSAVQQQRTPQRMPGKPFSNNAPGNAGDFDILKVNQDQPVPGDNNQVTIKASGSTNPGNPRFDRTRHHGPRPQGRAPRGRANFQRGPRRDFQQTSAVSPKAPAVSPNVVVTNTEPVKEIKEQKDAPKDSKNEGIFNKLMKKIKK